MSSENYEKLDLILDYESPFGQTKAKQSKIIVRLDGDEKLLNHQKLRLEFVDTIRQGQASSLQGDFTTNQEKILADLQALEERIKIHSTGDNYLTDLLTDLTGQVNQAFSRNDWFNKWGKHYLLSLTRTFAYSNHSIRAFHL